MSLSEEMNKLAPKLTIVFQLTVWSIVGIILLQKGTIALYEKTKTRNDTFHSQGNFTEWNKEEALAKLNGAESHPESVKFEIGTRQEDSSTIDHMDGATSRVQKLLELHAYRTGSTASEILKTISSIEKQTTDRRTDALRDARSSKTPTVYGSNENKMESTSYKENVPFDLNTNVHSYNRRNDTLHRSIPTISFPLKGSTSAALLPLNEKNFNNHEDNDMPDTGREKSKNEKKSRRSPMNRIGAAIAIIMLAIGIIMLLLGPLIVIVRAFSNRRRTREMLLKSREYNDRPPSYEEATLMDQAPRYSTLHVDNSDYMRNGDFLPTRLQAQQDAVNLVCHSKTRSNPENNVGLITLANVEVLATLTSDIGRILSKLHQVQPNGNLCLITGIRIAHLALKHRQGKNHKMRIVAFIGSPIEIDEKELVKLAKRLKKEKVTVDVISFGEETINNEVLTVFINALNGKDGTGSHLVTVPPGPHLSDALISSPIIQGEDGMGGTGIGGTAFEFGVDPNEDPELALALRVSMEEQRQRQEDEARRAQANEAATNKPSETIKEVPNEEAMLKRALAMSLEGTESSSSTSDTTAPATINAPDFARMTEEEQIAFAMQMSMQDQQELESLKEEAMEVEEDYAAVMSDPAFLQSVLENLPGVDPQSEAVRQAVGSLQQNKDKDKEKEKEKDKEKK